MGALFAVSALAGLFTASGDTLAGEATPLRAWHQAVRQTSVVVEDATADELLHQAALELALGAPERARSLLMRYRVPPKSPIGPSAYRLLAAAFYQDGDYEAAGRFFAAAASGAGGGRRGVLEARAGDAFERAGLSRTAVGHYRIALRELPGVSGWILTRLARLAPDTASAFEMLRLVSGPAARLALEVRVERLASAGAPQRAVAELKTAGRYGRAAGYALAAGDAATARRLAFAALAGVDSAEANAALDLLAVQRLARNQEQRLVVAQALERRARFAEAARWYAQIVALDDSSAAALLAWGAALESAGDRAGAQRVFTLARRAAGPAEAGAAEYALGRILARRGRTAAALAALTAFVRHHPTDSSVPKALMALADLRQQAGSRRRADSLQEVVLRDWPQSAAASEARFLLAGRAVSRRDLGRARALYGAVVEAGGPNALAARFVLGRLAMRDHDTAAARAQWTALAQADPLGYYGAVARRAAGLGIPAFPAPGPQPSTPALRDGIAALGVLDAIAFDQEAESLVSYLVGMSGQTPEQLLELAEGMLARGRPVVAASLGWRAASRLSLQHPRVLRVIFPWPWRGLVEAEAREFGIDPYLLAAMIRQESGFRRAVTSRAGARGLMQLMPGTAQFIASRLGVPWRERLLSVPDANLHLGAAHLAMLLRRYQGAVEQALAAYNAGGRPADRWVRMPDAKDPFWFVEGISYPETRGYVRSVVRNRALYQALYPPVASR